MCWKLSEKVTLQKPWTRTLNIHTVSASVPLTNSVREQLKLIYYLLRHGPFQTETIGDRGKKDDAD
jgi:hypothetical protein